MSGAGNRFLVADARSDNTPWTPDHVRNVIAENPRRDNDPIEGLLLLRSCSIDSVIADFYNPDGSHGMMCGNGARCIAKFACDQGQEQCKDIKLTINGMLFHCSVVNEESVCITFPPPSAIRHYPVGTLEGITVDTWYVNVGTDHVVIGSPLDAERPDVVRLRHHTAFLRGTNVNMVDQQTPVHIATFERGVESVTGACGTGALSCAVVAWTNNPATVDYTFVPPSGRTLTVHLEVVNTEIVGMTLTGDARYDNI
ncbi:MAG: diaminopimelate epimerase [Ignavibacteria bacterium]|nr:diaminopimelate epimerase [Ignavibacteria bacterium]